MITTGEGGAITTNSEHLMEKMRAFSSHGITRVNIEQQNVPEPEFWPHAQNSIGYNFRMSEINAALGISQLKKIDYFLDHKRVNQRI